MLNRLRKHFNHKQFNYAEKLTRDVVVMALFAGFLQTTGLLLGFTVSINSWVMTFGTLALAIACYWALQTHPNQKLISGGLIVYLNVATLLVILIHFASVADPSDYGVYPILMFIIVYSYIQANRLFKQLVYILGGFNVLSLGLLWALVGSMVVKPTLMIVSAVVLALIVVIIHQEIERQHLTKRVTEQEKTIIRLSQKDSTKNDLLEQVITLILYIEADFYVGTLTTQPKADKIKKRLYGEAWLKFSLLSQKGLIHCKVNTTLPAAKLLTNGIRIICRGTMASDRDDNGVYEYLEVTEIVIL